MVVYLPPGPSIITDPSRRLHHHHHHHDGTTITTTPSAAAASAVSTFLQKSLSPTTWLVIINYRLSGSSSSEDNDNEKGSKFQFPIPIHDVTTAFDQLTSTSPTLPWNNRDQQDREDGPGLPPAPPRICLLGSHIGGALATMLALTEPNRVHALAALEPMVDWVGLDELVKEQQQQQQRQQQQLSSSESSQKKRITSTHHSHRTAALVAAAAEKLIELRGRLFDSPSAYFDPFASPLLFLRAPGRDTPTPSWTQSSTSSALGQEIMGLDDHQQQDGDGGGSSSSATTSSDTEEAVVATPPPRRRKVLRRWPAVGNPDSILLPHVKVFVHAPPPPQPSSPAGSTMTGGKKSHAKYPSGTAPAAVTVDNHHHDGKNDPDQDQDLDDVQLGLTALKRAQGTELVQFMRRACFVGRDKSLAEERVVLHQFEQRQHQHQRQLESQNDTNGALKGLDGYNNGDHDHAQEQMQKQKTVPDSSHTNSNKDPTIDLDLHKAALQWIEDMFQQD
ncbi:hypothetical protein ABEF95_014130 [Exophiala dermatitidis]